MECHYCRPRFVIGIVVVAVLVVKIVPWQFQRLVYFWRVGDSYGGKQLLGYECGGEFMKGGLNCLYSCLPFSSLISCRAY